MSKIPQGEWNAIAARYAQGESISGIAQSYGCTPPAIHYILKRNKQRTAQHLGKPLNGRLEPLSAFAPNTAQRPDAPEISRPVGGPRGEEHGVPRMMPGESRVTHDVSAEPRAVAQQQPGNPRSTSRASAFSAGLDSELHGRAEAAIEAFRSSFGAALQEESPVVRQRLRQAASDLMRVAARTTIVLDRLNASAERASAQARDHLRPVHARENA